MNDRQKELLKIIVEEYIKTAEPVGSKLLVEKYDLNLSPATVRNDMAELEAENLIAQPHTSAGRVPTEEGYKFYIQKHVNLEEELKESEKDKIIKNIKTLKSETEEMTKNLAKILAEESGLGVFVGFGENNVFYTGLTNIFSQPEFQDLNLVHNMSRVLDHLDEVMAKMYHGVEDGVEVKIGRENPFASDCSAVITKVKNILFGVIGPMRMDYQNNVKLINFAKKII